MQAEMSLNKKESKMSYDNGFQSEESGSSPYPGEEHSYLGEKIKPQPPFYRRYVWHILVGVLIMLVLGIASFTALLIRQEQATVIRKVPTIAPTQPQIEPTQIPTPAPPTSVELL